MKPKRCSACGEWKARKYFYSAPRPKTQAPKTKKKPKRMRDGLRGICKACAIKQALAVQKKHPERTLENRRRSRAGIKKHVAITLPQNAAWLWGDQK